MGKRLHAWANWFVLALGILGAVWFISSRLETMPGDTSRGTAVPRVPLPPPTERAPGQRDPLPGGPVFQELPASQSGVRFSYFNDQRLDRMFGAETNGGGIGWIDFDGDGLPDLFAVNGCRLPYSPTDREHVNALFANRGDGRFVEVTSLAGVDDNQFGHGVAVGDFDNDGWEDLYLCNFGTNVLYQNCGDGTFQRVDPAIGAAATGWNAAAAFGDLDHDGDLDLYVSVYAVADLENVPVCYDSATGRHRVYCGPDYYTPTRHHLFLNNGDGTFRDATIETGCDKATGKGMGVVIADLDQDTWPEIFVANDMTPSFLYHNLRRSPGAVPQFEEIGVESGVAFNGNGKLVAGMGIACGDADGDGWLDLYVSHYHREGNTFYRNKQRLSFADETARMNLLIPSLPYLGFGCEFIDYDNDGWLDLYVANGHVLGPAYPEAKMRPQLYRNLSGMSFEEVTEIAGPYFAGAYLGRGSASADFDNDGRIDLAVLHLDRPLALLRNVVPACGHAIGFKLVGVASNRDGINAQLVASLEGRRLVRQVLAGGSYQSAPDQRILVGTGDAERVDQLHVTWPSGREDRWENLTVGGLYLLREGSPPRLAFRW